MSEISDSYSTSHRRQFENGNDDTRNGIAIVKEGDSLWSLSKGYLRQSGHQSNNREIARLVQQTAVENHLKNPDFIVAGQKVSLHLPPVDITERPISHPQTQIERVSAPARAMSPDMGKVPQEKKISVIQQSGVDAKPDVPKSVEAPLNMKIVDEANSLHKATVGPLSVLSAPSVDFNILEGAISRVPVIGSDLTLQLPLTQSKGNLKSDMSKTMSDAKHADPIGSTAAIEKHAKDLESQVVSGVSTFASGFVGMKAASVGLEQLAKVGMDIPNPLVKGASFLALAALGAVAANEATQAAAHVTLGTQMDSQRQIASESVGSVAAMALLHKLPVALKGGEAYKLKGILATSTKATFARAGVGVVPGAALALATKGPWNTDGKTQQHYTAEQTLGYAAGYGASSAIAFGAGPWAWQYGANFVKSSASVALAGAATNAVYEAGSVNPTQLDPSTGKRYSVAETAGHAGESLLAGAVGGVVVGKLLPAAVAIGAYKPVMIFQAGKWLTDHTAGELSDVAGKVAKEPASWARGLNAAVKPIGDGVKHVGEGIDQGETLSW